MSVSHWQIYRRTLKKNQIKTNERIYGAGIAESRAEQHDFFLPDATFSLQSVE